MMNYESSETNYDAGTHLFRLSSLLRDNKPITMGSSILEAYCFSPKNLFLVLYNSWWWFFPPFLFLTVASRKKMNTRLQTEYGHLDVVQTCGELCDLLCV